MLEDTQAPNLFLVGAPKCGTTSMAHYLSQHPNVFLSEYKEPNYFAPDFAGRDITTMAAYRGLFRHAGPAHRWRLDASNLYMYLRNPIDNILSFNPDARFIVMVRDPMTMLPSWFSHMRQSRNGREDAASLDEAWSLIGERKRGRKLPEGCTDGRLLFYDEIAMYAQQLGHVLERVPPSRVHVIVYDDLRAAPQAVFGDVCTFLDIDCPDSIDFSPRMERRQWRSGLIRGLHRTRLRRVARRALGMFGLGGSSPSVRRLLSKPVIQTPVSARAQTFIRDRYAEDVAGLERLIGRPLAGWLRGAPGPSA